MKILNTIVILTIILVSCSENPISSDINSNFSIHFLKNTNLTIEQVKEYDLSKIEYNTTPWLSSEDINFYDFSSHNIYLKTGKKDFIPYLQSDFELPESWWQKPFIVAAYNKPCYIGCFYPSVFVKAPEGVFISDDIYKDNIDDILHISYRGNLVLDNDDLLNDSDIRNNTLIKEALADDKILHMGLELTIDSIKIIENSDSATVRYTFTITNNDQDNLYVLDSDKMERKVFRFISQGIVFWSEKTSYISSNEHIRETINSPFKNWESSWFTKIGSKNSITRTLCLKGYPNIPVGNYYCFLKFTSTLYIEKAKRNLSDGRYWIGEISANPTQFRVD